MTTARDIISKVNPSETTLPVATVEPSLAVTDVIPKLIEAPDHLLAVIERGEMIGIITSQSALEGIAAFFPSRTDSSTIEVECTPADYSASILSHAAEDMDAHVIGLWTAPAEGGKIRVTMRLSCSDPIHVVRNLERYGFNIVAIHSNTDSVIELATRRLQELQMYLSM